MKLPVKIARKGLGASDTEAIIVEPRPTKRSRSVYFGVGVLMTLLVVVTVLGLLTYVKVSEGVSKQDFAKIPLEADVRYHLSHTDQTLDEQLVVTDNEEEITTKDAKIIFDYTNGFAVTKLTGPDAEDKDSVCFISAFSPSTGINKVRENVQKGKKDEFVTSDIGEEFFVPSGNTFNRSLLSERAATMCAMSKLVPVKKTTTNTKRSIGDDRSHNKPILPLCVGHFWEIRCGFFCTNEIVVKTVIQLFGPDGLLNWNGGVVGGLKYVTKAIEMNRCVLRCYCYGDGTPAPGTTPTAPGTTPTAPSTTPPAPSTTPPTPSTTPPAPSTTPSAPSTTPSAPSTTPPAPSTTPSAPSTMRPAPSTTPPAPSTTM